MRRPEPPTLACAATLVKQRSTTACVVNLTFGCSAADDAVSIWVDKGCRGRFDCGNGQSTNCGEQYYSPRRWTCPCRTPENASRTMSALMHREDRSQLGVERGPVAVVMHTHTMSSREALVLAREQLSAHPSRLFQHHVVLRALSSARCGAMRAMLPFAENVSCVDDATVAALLPAIGQSGLIMNSNKAPCERRRPFRSTMCHEDERSRAGWARGNGLGVGSRQWAWSNCDSTYLAWFAKLGLRSPRWFWFCEWDVTWSGNLGTILASYHGYRDDNGLSVLDSSSARSEDLLCDVPKPARPVTSSGYKHNKNGRGFAHFQERNRTEFAFDDVWTCVIQFVRMSSRLLRWVVSESRRPERGIFCEMRAATMCSIAAERMHPPCVVGEVARGEQEQFFETRRRLHDAKRHPTFNWRSIVNRSVIRGFRGERVYHRYKWDG
jgi:hypothetical protein